MSMILGTRGDAGRRTQAGRSLETRTRILQATFEALVECGFEGTTTIEIARRANVSRGAELHHFPTRDQVIIAAIDDLLERNFSAFRARVSSLDVGRRTVEAVIDIIWSLYEGPSFTAWLEFAVAARTDPDLQSAFAKMNQRFMDQVTEIVLEMMPTVELGEEAMLGIRFAFALLRGLALERTLEVRDDAEAVLNLLKNIASDRADPFARQGRPESLASRVDDLFEVGAATAAPSVA